MAAEEDPACSAGVAATGFGSYLTCNTGGSLSDDPTSFILPSDTYTISALLHARTLGSGQPRDLLFNVGTTIPDRSGLVLQLNSREYTFSSVDTVGNATRAFAWLNPGGLTWSAGETVSVKLCVNE